MDWPYPTTSHEPTSSNISDIIAALHVRCITADTVIQQHFYTTYCYSIPVIAWHLGFVWKNIAQQACSNFDVEAKPHYYASIVIV